METHRQKISCRDQDGHVPRYITVWWKPFFVAVLDHFQCTSICASRYKHLTKGQITDHRLRLNWFPRRHGRDFPCCKAPSLSVKPAGCFPSGWRMTLYSYCGLKIAYLVEMPVKWATPTSSRETSSGLEGPNTSSVTGEADPSCLPHSSANSVDSFLHPNENGVAQKAKQACIPLVYGLAKLDVGGYYLTCWWSCIISILCLRLWGQRWTAWRNHYGIILSVLLMNNGWISQWVQLSWCAFFSNAVLVQICTSVTVYLSINYVFYIICHILKMGVKQTTWNVTHSFLPVVLVFSFCTMTTDEPKRQTSGLKQPINRHHHTKAKVHKLI